MKSFLSKSSAGVINNHASLSEEKSVTYHEVIVPSYAVSDPEPQFGKRRYLFARLK